MEYIEFVWKYFNSSPRPSYHHSETDSLSKSPLRVKYTAK